MFSEVPADIKTHKSISVWKDRVGGYNIFLGHLSQDKWDEILEVRLVYKIKVFTTELLATNYVELD